MQPLVIEFLKTHSFKQLADEHGVKARHSSDRSKFGLNYDQIASKPGQQLPGECRGLVIRPATLVENDDQIVGDCTVVSRPMDRFYNEGDPNAAKIDWSTARIGEKLDGTMIHLYHDDVKNEWCIATRSVCEADLPFNDTHPTIRTFSDLFKHAVNETLTANVSLLGLSYDDWTQTLDKSKTYIYELTGPLNRVVVKYDVHRATLLACRETATGREFDIYSECHEAAGLDIVKEWPISDIDSLIAFVDNADPKKIEGAVVIDANFNRLKVKNKQWVFASRSKDLVTLSQRNALECIINGKLDDIIPLLDDDIVRSLCDTRTRLVDWARTIDMKFKVCNSLADFKLANVKLNLPEFQRQWKKEYASIVKEYGVWESPMFAMVNPKNGSTCLEWLQKLGENDKLTPILLDRVLDLISRW